jgi:hypothetical protein
MNALKVWNTVRAYSNDGQVIAAIVVDSGKVYFSDGERYIEGLITENFVSGIDDIKQFVMHYYDAGLYEEGLYGEARYIRDELQKAIKVFKEDAYKFKVAKVKEDINHVCDGPVTELVAICRALTAARVNDKMDEQIIAEALIEVLKDYGYMEE